MELDSWEFHGDRRSFETDRERDARHLVPGIVTVRLTWTRLHARPAQEAKRLHTILAARHAAA